MKLTLRHYASVATLALAGASFAVADLDMCLSADAENPTNFTGTTVGLIGSTFELYIWVRSINQKSYSGIEAAVGISTATASGTNAAAQDNKVRFGNGTGASSWASLGAPFGMAGVFDNQGLRSAGAAGTPRPWGASFSMAATPPAKLDLTGTWFRLLCIVFRNTGIAAGESYSINIWDCGTGSSRTSFGTVAGSTTVVRPGTCDFRLTAVPEPASMAALGLGAAVLIRRRRKVA